MESAFPVTVVGVLSEGGSAATNHGLASVNISESPYEISIGPNGYSSGNSCGWAW